MHDASCSVFWTGRQCSCRGSSRTSLPVRCRKRNRPAWAAPPHGSSSPRALATSAWRSPVNYSGLAYEVHSFDAYFDERQLDAASLRIEETEPMPNDMVDSHQALPAGNSPRSRLYGDSPTSHLASAASAPQPLSGGLDDGRQQRSSLADINNSLYRTMARADAQLAMQSQPSLPASQRSVESSQWELDPDKILIGERIAIGGFAEVFVGKYEGTIVAIKLLLHVDEAAMERFRREVTILAALRHPNLLLFMGFATAPTLAIVSEYMQRGSLFSILRKREGRPLEPKLQRAVARSVARGMAHLHSRTPIILHLDLKSPNILVDAQWRVKLADFGLSRLLRSGRKNVTAGVESGTPEWMAPEVLRTEGYNMAADVYSYGVVLWETLTGEAPWENMHPMQVVGAVGFQRKQLPRPKRGDEFLIGLAMRCMQQDASLRPSFVQILEELENEYAPKKPEVQSLSVVGSHASGAPRLARPDSEALSSPRKQAGAAGGTSQSSPDQMRADSAEDDRSTPRVDVHSRPSTPATTPMHRGCEDSAMQLFQGQSSCKTERAGSNGSSEATGDRRSEASVLPTVGSGKQWTPLREKHMPVGTAAAAALQQPTGHSNMPAATEDSMCVTASRTALPLPETSADGSTAGSGFAAYSKGVSGSGDAQPAAVAAASQVKPSSATGQITAASRLRSGGQQDIVQQLATPPCSPTQQDVQQPASPQTPVLAGKTPFELAALNSPFSTPSPVRAAANAIAADRPSRLAVPPSNYEMQPIVGSAPAAPLSPFQAVSERATAAMHAPPRSSKQKVTGAMPATAVSGRPVSTASAPAGYKSPFEAAAELAPAFSLAPPEPRNRSVAGSGSPTKSGARQGHGNTSAGPAAASATFSPAASSQPSTTSAALSAAGSGMSTVASNVTSAASSGWTSAQEGSQASDSSAASAGSSLTKQQLRKRLAHLKAAQFERLKSASTASTDRLSDGGGGGSRRHSDSLQDSGGAGVDRQAALPAAGPLAGETQRSEEGCAAAAAHAEAKARASSEARRSQPNSLLNVIEEEGSCARSLPGTSVAPHAAPSFDATLPVGGASSEALLEGVRALHMMLAQPPPQQPHG